MESLGDWRELFVEHFRFVEKKPNPLRIDSPTFPPAHHGNLLASSSRHGYLFVASADQIYVYLLRVLRDKAPGVLAEARLDLSKHDIQTILDISLVLHDNALLVRAVPKGEDDSCVLVFSTQMLIQGKAALLHGPPLQRGLKAVAVHPQTYGHVNPGEASTQLLALLYGKADIQLHAIEMEVEDEEGRTTSLKCSIEAQGKVTSLALSPDEQLLAVGLMRGSVVIYDTKEGVVMHNITEIESGQNPISMHFLADDTLMVSYAREECVFYVVWNLFRSEKVLSVTGHSALGELCVQMQSTSSSSSDSGDDSTNMNDPPMIWCHRIPGWDICVVASSKSNDIETIALSEDGVWERWSLDDGKTATLPNDESDMDTFPIGIALDLTDTTPVDATEPALPPLNPMPRVVAFTTLPLLLPYALVDDRPNASCEFIETPRPISKAPANHKPMSKLVFKMPPSNVGDSNQEDSPVLMPSQVQAPLNQEPSGRELPVPTPPPQKSQITIIPKVAPKPQFDSLPPSREEGKCLASKQVSSGDIFQFPPQLLRLDPTKPSASSEDISQNSTYEKSSDNSGTSSMGSTDPSPKRGSGRKIFEIVKPTSPKFTGLNDIYSSLGEPGDFSTSLQAILAEMNSELAMNRTMEDSMHNALCKINDRMVPHVDSIKCELAAMLEVLRTRFRDEASLRRDILNSLKGMNALSREYESACLEFRVREEEGFVSHLQAEDTIIDNEISKKEAEIIKSISAMEQKLSSSHSRRSRRMNEAGQVQQIYSALSLQGIRVKKLCSLLSALSDRMDELDRGGRRTDLGLSMARLEKLSISSAEKPSSINAHGTRVPRGAERGLGELANHDMPALIPSGCQISEESLIPSDVQKVLRRLAMRNGRADIVVQGSNRRASNLQGVVKAKHLTAQNEDENCFQNDILLLANRGAHRTREVEAEPSCQKAHDTTYKSTNAQNRQLDAFPQQSRDGRSSLAARNHLTGKRPAPSVEDSPKDLHETNRSETDIVSPVQSSESNLPRSARTEQRDVHTNFNQSGRSTQNSNQFIPPKSASRPRRSKANGTSTVIEGQRMLGSSSDGSKAAVTDPMAPGPSGPSLNPSGSPFGSKGDSGALQRRANKPPFLPHVTNKFSTVPLKPADVQKTMSAAEANSRSSVTAPVSKAPVAFLPPDADLPSQNSVKTSASTTEKTELKESPASASGSVFATLPPDGDLKVGEVASLPPDDDLGKDFSAMVPAGAVQRKRNEERPTPQRGTATSNFASLPPDPDLKSAPSTSLPELADGSAPTNNSDVTNFSAISISSQPTKDAHDGPSLFGKTNAELSTSSFFGNKLTLQTKQTTSMFGTTPVPESKPGSEEQPGNVSLFGTRPQATASPFASVFSSPIVTQSVQPANPSEDAVLDDSQPPIDADNSDSDDENNFRQESKPGAMPFRTTSTNTQTSFEGFGGQATSMQSNPSPFATTNTQPTHASLFGNTPSQQTGFGSSATKGTGFSPFAATTASSSFSSPPFGQTVAFGAPSSLGGGGSASFGFASQVGDSSQTGTAPRFGESSQFGGTPQFGANSQLGAGFGAQSSLGGSPAPFASQSATATSGFGIGGSSFGGGMSNPKFGESSFGTPTQTGFSAGGASPFAAEATSGALFGGQSGGSSGFAALAASQPFGGAAGSGFGSGVPIFGNSQGPPSFTSPAFSERRS